MREIVVLTFFLTAAATLNRYGSAGEASALAVGQQGVSAAPVGMSCPSSHPIKVTTANGERCIFHSPGERSYDKTRPERCYISPC
jgi:hypothetical protein